jgi:6-phosphogluconate dehydrogenase
VVLDSFFIEITSSVRKFKDDDGEPVVDKILDEAGQKGTVKWTAIAALTAGSSSGNVYWPFVALFSLIKLFSPLFLYTAFC